MKYAVFFLALVGVPPLAVILSFNRQWTKYAVWAMIGALAVYQSTAINFFSHEHYRGSSRGMEVSVVYLFALALLILSAIKGRFPKLVPSVGAFLFVIYFFLCLPSFATAENMLYSWMEIWKMIMLYMTYLSVRAYLDVTGDLKSLMRGLAAFALFNFLLVAKDHIAGVYQPDGTFPHQNGLAMAMHLFANLFFASFLVSGWRKSKMTVVAFLASVGCIVRTYSRGAIAMVPLSFAITFFLSVAVAAKGTLRKVFVRILPIAVAGLICLGLMLPRIIERFDNAPEASGKTRVELALCAKEMILDEPWRGVGINNWGIKINQPYEYAERAGRKPNRGEDFMDGIVETVYLLVCAECGIPALVAMVAWFLSYLVLCLVLLKRLAGTKYAAIPAGLAGGLVACYLQSFLEWVLRQQMNLILLFFFFAILDYLNANWRRLRKESLPSPSEAADK